MIRVEKIGGMMQFKSTNINPNIVEGFSIATIKSKGEKKMTLLDEPRQFEI